MKRVLYFLPIIFVVFAWISSTLSSAGSCESVFKKNIFFPHCNVSLLLFWTFVFAAVISAIWAVFKAQHRNNFVFWFYLASLLFGAIYVVVMSFIVILLWNVA